MRAFPEVNVELTLNDRIVWGCPVSVDGLLAIGLRVGHGGLHVGFVGHG
jgi:hypothetical protein